MSASVGGKRRRHRRAARPVLPRPRRLVEWVDLRSTLRHYLTLDDAAAGRKGGGHYVALCGAVILPAGMTEPGTGTCPNCVELTVPNQGSRRSWWR
jgi:hypothetical protein